MCLAVCVLRVHVNALTSGAAWLCCSLAMACCCLVGKCPSLGHCMRMQHGMSGQTLLLPQRHADLPCLRR